MRLRLAAGLTAVAALLAGWQAAPMMRLAAGFHAKTLCSGVFVAGRAPERVVAEDILAGMASGLRAFRATIDRDGGRVTASLHGLFERTAVFRPGLGCTLVSGSGVEALRAQGRGLPTERPALPPDRLWPAGRKVAESAAAGGSAREALSGFLDAAFAEPDPETPRRTRAVVIVQDGRIIAERYGEGIDALTPLSGWSMAKGAVNALVGILVGEGRLALEKDRLLPAWEGPGDLRARITVEQLLRMTSGLAFDDPNVGRVNDVRRMLYLSGDTAHYAASKPSVAEPGSAWAYSSGATSILCALVRDAASARGGHPMAFPNVALFDKIGMTGAVFERDAAGTLVGPAFLHASARDWARLGLLYLQDGVWAGERILPEGWVAFSTRAAEGSNGLYGAHLWRRVPDFLRPVNAARRALPDDTFYMLGRDGQMLAVVPSRALVAVRLGLSRDRAAWDPEEFLSDLLDVLP